MGIGGGFFMTYYSRETGTAEALIAREQAPSYAHQDMFEDDPDAAAKGPFSMAIPGEIRGYVAAKERYGNSAITWDRLVAPTVTMCREGVEVAFSLASALRSSKTQIVNDPGLSEVFLNPATGDVWQEGDHYTCPKLADTLERLAQNPDDFYTGETARMMTEDLRTVGGNLTLNDMASYTCVYPTYSSYGYITYLSCSPFWVDPVSAAIGSSGYTVHSVPPPSSGGLLIYMLNVLGHYNLSVDSADEPVTYHRIVEALKWAYAERTHMGDPRDPEITDYINSVRIRSNITLQYILNILFQCSVGHQSDVGRLRRRYIQQDQGRLHRERLRLLRSGFLCSRRPRHHAHVHHCTQW